MAETEYNIKINADTSNANASLDTSAAKMSRLENVVRSMNNTINNSFAQMFSSLRNTGNAIDKIDSKAAATQQAFSKMSIKSLITEIDKAAGRLDTLTAKYKQEDTLGADKNSKSFRRLAYQIDETAHKLDAMNNEVAGRLPAAIAEVKKQMDAISRVPTAEFKALTEDFQRAEAALGRLIEKENAMDSAGVNKNSMAWKNLQWQIEQAENEIKIIQNMQDSLQAKGKLYEKVDPKAYKELETNLKQYEAKLQQTNQNYVKSVSDMVSQVEDAANKAQGTVAEKLGKGIAQAAGKAQKAVKKITDNFNKLRKSAKKALDNIVKQFKNVYKNSNFAEKAAKNLTNQLLRLRNMFIARLKRMAVSAVFSDLQANFSALAHISPRFNKSVSSMIDSAKALGAQLIATLEPIVAKIGPAISYITDKLTEAASVLAQFTARLFGDNTFLKAEKGQSDYAKSLDKTTSSTNKANAAANKYKRTVLGFDQLHKLESQDNALGIDSADIEEALTQSTALNEIADNIREAFLAGDFLKFGKEIAGVINKAFGWLSDTVGWTKNANKFTKALKNVINTVNGFIKGLDARTIGRSIGDAVNTIFNSLKLLTDPAEGIDFKAAGTKLGDLLLNAFDEINWQNIGTSIVQSVEGGIRFINGLLEADLNGDTLGGKVGKSFEEMFRGAVEAIHPQEWGSLFANIINNITDMIVNLFGDTSNIETLAEDMAETLNTAIEKIDAEKLGNAIAALAGTFVTFFDTLFNEINWDNVWDLLKSTLSSQNFDWITILEAVGIVALPSLIVTTLTTGLSSLGSVVASAAATIASNPAVLTAAAAAFGVTGAFKGVEGIVKGVPKAVESTKDVFVGDNSLQALNDLGAEFDTLGGAFGAAVATYLDGSKVISDVNGEFVSLQGVIMTAQDYVDKTAGELLYMGDDMINATGFVTDEMKALREKLIAQGSAVDNSAGVVVDKFDPSISTASDSLGNFSSSLDALSVRMDNTFDDVRSIIQTDYGDGARAYSVPHFARGGLIGDGELFIANENGAELIGSDGRGNTAVVNNEQIISAVVQGVRQAVMEAGMNIAERVADSNNNGGDTVIEIDSIEIARAANKGNKRIGRRSNHSVNFA